MSSTKTLIPVRVPELGPSLGSLVEETPTDIVGLPVDEIRLGMVTKLFSNASDARRLASTNDRESAVASLSSDAWLALWEETVMQVSEALLQWVSREIESEIRRVRMPAKLSRRLQLTEDDRRAVRGRLGSAGAPLVAVLRDIDGCGAALLGAPATRPGDLEAWQAAQLKAARRLEEAWRRLEESVRFELSDWTSAVHRIGRWRRSRIPALLFLVVSMAAAVWLGLVFGGYVPSPDWFTNLWQGIVGP